MDILVTVSLQLRCSGFDATAVIKMDILLKWYSCVSHVLFYGCDETYMIQKISIIVMVQLKI